MGQHVFPTKSHQRTFFGSYNQGLRWSAVEIQWSLKGLLAFLLGYFHWQPLHFLPMLWQLSAPVRTAWLSALSFYAVVPNGRYQPWQMLWMTCNFDTLRCCSNRSTCKKGWEQRSYRENTWFRKKGKQCITCHICQHILQSESFRVEWL